MKEDSRHGHFFDRDFNTPCGASHRDGGKRCAKCQDVLSSLAALKCDPATGRPVESQGRYKTAKTLKSRKGRSPSDDQ